MACDFSQALVDAESLTIHAACICMDGTVKTGLWPMEERALLLHLPEWA